MVARDEVMAWVAEYERSWREDDVYAVERLFTEDVHYRRSPYEPDDIGHHAIKGFWLEDAGLPFRMSAVPVAVDDATAVVRVVVNYEGEAPQEYTDLWVLRFAADGRVAEFEEWAYWPDRPYSTAGNTAADDQRDVEEKLLELDEQPTFQPEQDW